MIRVKEELGVGISLLLSIIVKWAARFSVPLPKEESISTYIFRTNVGAEGFGIKLR